MTSIAATAPPEHAPGRRRPGGRLRALRGPVIGGAAVGILQAMSPLAFWWLEPKTVYALGIALIAAIYIGFSVADGRWHVIAIESTVAGFFVVVAAMSVSGSAWLLVLGLAGHGLKDLWQHRALSHISGWSRGGFSWCGGCACGGGGRMRARTSGV
jgi:hypothetical protein